MLSKVASSTIFLVFGMTLPGIEPWSPRLLANTLNIMPMSGDLRCTSDLITVNCSLKVDLLYWSTPEHTVSYWLAKTYPVAVINDTRSKEDAGNFFTNIFTSHFIARVRKGCM